MTNIFTILFFKILLVFSGLPHPGSGSGIQIQIKKIRAQDPDLHNNSCEEPKRCLEWEGPVQVREGAVAGGGETPVQRHPR